MADSKTKKKCSFCGRSENEVGFLITGMNGYICDSCATQAYEITQEALGEGRKRAGATKLNLKELPKPVEIKKFLDQYVTLSFCISLQPLQASFAERQR